MIKVLFVCLGNICRSPMAEGVFLSLIHEKGLSQQFEVESAGTANYHIGSSPDSRTLKVAQQHGVFITSKARQITVDDLRSFDYIFAMDRQNLKDILSLKKSDSMKAEIKCFREFDMASNGNLDVPDPYYDGLDAFEEVYQIVQRCSSKALEYILRDKNQVVS